MSNRNITINVPSERYAAFERLCQLSGASKNEYGNALFDYAISHALLAGENFSEAEARIAAIKRGDSPLPKVTLEIKAGPPEPLPGESIPLAAETPTTYKTILKKWRAVGAQLKRAGEKDLGVADELLSEAMEDLERATPQEGDGRKRAT